MLGIFFYSVNFWQFKFFIKKRSYPIEDIDSLKSKTIFSGLSYARFENFIQLKLKA